MEAVKQKPRKAHEELLLTPRNRADDEDPLAAEPSVFSGGDEPPFRHSFKRRKSCTKPENGSCCTLSALKLWTGLFEDLVRLCQRGIWNHAHDLGSFKGVRGLCRALLPRTPRQWSR